MHGSDSESVSSVKTGSSVIQFILQNRNSGFEKEGRGDKAEGFFSIKSDKTKYLVLVPKPCDMYT